MGYLLDTCALSELVSKFPHLPARSVLVSLPRSEIHLSIITVGEVHAGIVEMTDCPRKNFLIKWFNDHVLGLYLEHTFHIDHAIALRWGTMLADLRARGKTMPESDSLIAATALVHDLSVVTRNEAHFANSGVRILNPWKS